MLTIKNNVMASNAARHLGTSYSALATSVERLSSGLRINSAKDDAAGLAVRELMRADIAVLQQGSRNAQDAISMLQTMEGALGVIDDALIRMKELAEQAATGSYSSDQRGIMDAEFKQMADEIERIAVSTEFNSTKMLNSASGSTTIHFGSKDSAGGFTAGEGTIDIASVDVTKAGLGIDTLSIDTATSAVAALSAVDSAIKAKDTARARFGYSMNRLESTAEVISNQTENMIASESRVSDVDVASEMAKLTRNQVLAQAGVSMLSQANSMPQMALNLLR